MKNTKTFIALKKYITEIIRLLSNFDTITLYLCTSVTIHYTLLDLLLLIIIILLTIVLLTIT